MDEHADTRGQRVGAEADHIVRLQTILARRVLLIFALPLLVIMVLGVYAYRLSGRVQALEALQHITFIERIAQKNHSHEWAISEYEKLAQWYAHPQVLVRLGALYFERGNAEGKQLGLEMLERAKTLQPDYLEIYSTATYFSVRQNKVAETIANGEKALALNKFDAQTYNNLAWLYATHEAVLDLAKAQEYALKAVKYTVARDPDCLDTLVVVYMKTGQLDLARATIDEAIQNKVVDPEYFQARLNTLHELRTAVRPE
jgi:tetratricopeptide (TPR) repeat protein